jgi:ATP-dependent Clp protease ATP-binding subunit ClpX
MFAGVEAGCEMWDAAVHPSKNAGCYTRKRRQMKEKREIYRFLHVTPRRIFEQLDQYVIGQRHAKEVLAIAAYNHLKRIEYLKFGGEISIRKSNILMIGPSGSGKTYLARTLAKILDVPFAYNDATAFTEAGYYGEDVEVAIGRLLYATNQNVSSAENGIVFIDEIDKIARRSGGARTGAGSRDIGGEGVQQALLKILEGEKIFVPLNVTAHWNKYDYVEIDIANILFICAGSFSDMEESSDGKAIGFFNDGSADAHEISTDDLTRYGFLPELLGRLPVRVQLDALSAEDLVAILTQPREAMIPEYQRLCALDQIQLEFSTDSLAEIANAALRQKLGARALRAILEKVLHPILFVAPERAGERITIEPDDVRRAVAAS